jgi:replicative DNA helicase Mcm
MDDSARKSMHEAMEDQIIPVNKAGINTTLTSKTSVLAAANPNGGRFDRFSPLAEQINLGDALISRFDLVFALEDSPDADADREIARHQYNVANGDGTEPAIEPDLLREYIAYARQRVDPAFDDDEAVALLVDKYVDTRQQNDDGDDDMSPIPVTARMNESLRRLAEAAARSELSDTVHKRHAERAIELYELTIGDIGLTEDGNLDAAKASGYTQHGTVEAVKNVLRKADDDLTLDEIQEQAGLSESKAEHYVEKLRQKGDIYEPKQGEYRSV